jgi:hypothetical protein
MVSCLRIINLEAYLLITRKMDLMTSPEKRVLNKIDLHFCATTSGKGAASH